MSFSEQRHAPATLRNRDAIVAVLQTILPASGTVLESASGTGEHIIYFGRQFPQLQFLPSDPDPVNLQSIAAWTARERVANILPPLGLDTMAKNWDVEPVAAVLCINMIHIAPWEASIGLFEKAAAQLESGAPLYLYGPYFRDDVETAQGNLEFAYAVSKAVISNRASRDGAEINNLAARTGLPRESLVEMPANNISLVYRKS